MHSKAALLYKPKAFLLHKPFVAILKSPPFFEPKAFLLHKPFFTIPSTPFPPSISHSHPAITYCPPKNDAVLFIFALNPHAVTPEPRTDSKPFRRRFVRKTGFGSCRRKFLQNYFRQSFESSPESRGSQPSISLKHGRLAHVRSQFSLFRRSPTHKNLPPATFCTSERVFAVLFARRKKYQSVLPFGSSEVFQTSIQLAAMAASHEQN